jgi:hypothetical protein
MQIKRLVRGPVRPLTKQLKENGTYTKDKDREKNKH